MPVIPSSSAFTIAQAYGFLDGALEVFSAPVVAWVVEAGEYDDEARGLPLIADHDSAMLTPASAPWQRLLYPGCPDSNLTELAAAYFAQRDKKRGAA